MIPLRVDELPPLGELDARGDEITGVQVDTRRLAPGNLFVAVGRGVDFLDEARARGAATLVPHDPFEAMAALGSLVRERAPARVVGITGSTGKTSTKDILAALCATAARTVAAEASYNNELGVPLTLCRLEPDTEVCILELAMRGFGQIADLCRIARPQVGVVTNVGPVHLELVGSLEGVLRAKGELVAALPPDGVAIVPEEFPVERDDIQIVRLREPAVERAGDRTVVDGVSFNFTARHQTGNAAAALAALDALGLPRPERVEVEWSRWRGEELPLPGGGLLINDAYNANPTSMRAALAHLAETAGDRRRVAILGDMAELGPSAPAFHEEIGREVARHGVAALLAVGELSRGYVDTAVGVRVTRWAPDADAAAREAGELVRPGDCVLVKASRAVGLEVVADALSAAAVSA